MPIDNNTQYNLAVSFRNVKEDVFELRQEINLLSNHLAQAVSELEQLKHQHEQDLRKIAQLKNQTKTIVKKVPVVKTQTVVKKVATRKKEVIIAPKDGSGKAHLKSCPFAKNIKKKIEFKTKTQAFKKGYKACTCLR